MTDYFGVNNFNSAYAQQANRRANQAEREAIAIKGEMEAKLNSANRELENLRNEKKAPVDAMINMINAQKELNKNLNIEKDKNIKLESEKEFYKNLLSKPMQEIASKNENFKETYEAQQFYLAEWIVSEMAFAETAYQIGIDVGKSKEEISEMYMENKVMVLHNQTNHGNNALSNKVVRENLDKLEDKILKKAQLNRIT